MYRGIFSKIVSILQKKDKYYSEAEVANIETEVGGVCKEDLIPVQIQR